MMIPPRIKKEKPKTLPKKGFNPKNEEVIKKAKKRIVIEESDTDDDELEEEPPRRQPIYHEPVKYYPHAFL